MIICFEMTVIHVQFPFNCNFISIRGGSNMLLYANKKN